MIIKLQKIFADSVRSDSQDIHGKKPYIRCRIFKILPLNFLQDPMIPNLYIALTWLSNYKNHFLTRFGQIPRISMKKNPYIRCRIFIILLLSYLQEPMTPNLYIALTWLSNYKKYLLNRFRQFATISHKKKHLSDAELLKFSFWSSFRIRWHPIYT
jgi:hypothetical protein